MSRLSPRIVRVFAIALIALVAVVALQARAEAATGVLVVNNHGCGCVDVYIDGNFAGHVEGHCNESLRLGTCCHGCSDIEIRDEYGNAVWSRHASGHFRLFACIH